MKTSNKLMVIFVILMFALFLITACGSPAEIKPEDDAVPTEGEPQIEYPIRLSAGVGGAGGMFYVMGSGWAATLNTTLKGKYQITAEQTGGAPANVSLLESGEIDFGHGGTSVMGDAFYGTGWADGTKYTKLRAAFPMITMSITPFTLKGNNINTLHDLDGKRVGLGSKGAGIDSVWRDNFEKLGITPSMIHNDTWAATVAALSDGVIDAVITQQVAPWPSLLELETTRDVEFIQLTDDVIEMILEHHPYYSPSIIPKGAYKANNDYDYVTLAEWAYMQASIDVPEQVVYDIVKATFEAYDDLLKVHPGLANVLAENAAYISVTWHPGAIRYYEEAGIKLQEPHPMFTPQE